jgi:hypothetical protein
MRKVTILVIAACAAALAYGDVNGVRRGRRIQADGFLLEWRGADARAWPGSAWRWDALSTADGVAGYFEADTGAAGCRDWAFAVRAAKAGKALSMRIPGPPSGGFFAFDREAFDAGGALRAEWIVPWEFFDDAGDPDAYELSVSAVSACGDTLQPLVLSVKDPKSPGAPEGLLTKIVMIVLVAALTVILAAVRRKKIKNQYQK